MTAAPLGEVFVVGPIEIKDNMEKERKNETEVSTSILGLGLLNFGDEIIFFRWSKL